MSTQTMLTTGERLRIARERAGVSVQQLADRIGRHRNSITNYEHAGDDLALPVLQAYAEHLGNVTVAWLAAEVGEPPTSVGIAGCITVLDPGQFSLFHLAAA